MKGIFPSSFTRRPLRALTPPTDTHTPVAPFLSILQRHRRPINIRARFSNRIGRKKWKVISLRTIDRRVSATARPLSRCHDSARFREWSRLTCRTNRRRFSRFTAPYLRSASNAYIACTGIRERALRTTCLYEAVAALINALPKFVYETYVMAVVARATSRCDRS